MAALTEIKEQTRKIATLCYEIEDLLKSKSVMTFFENNPDSQGAIKAQAQQLASYPIVMYGMYEHNVRLLGSSALDSRETLESRPENYWNTGDVLLGWVGFTAGDAPRVIKASLSDGYTWRYLDDDDGVSRNPVKFDRYFQGRGWITADTESNEVADIIDDIHAQQATEIAALQGYKTYFQTKQYAAA
ncbi:MAG: hypothetical protein AAF528_01240 [Cyanobacteria bacterium P01_C01_bin.121]